MKKLASHNHWRLNYLLRKQQNRFLVRHSFLLLRNNHLVGHLNTVTCIAIAPNDYLIASGSSDRTIQIWDMKGNLKQTLSGHTNWITSLCFSRTGQHLASASRDGTIRLWKMDRYTKLYIDQPIQILKDHQAPVLAVKFSPTDAIFASCGEDAKIRLWRDDGTECVFCLLFGNSKPDGDSSACVS